MKQCLICSFNTFEDILRCPNDDSLLINTETKEITEEILEPEVEDLNNGGVIVENRGLHNYIGINNVFVYKLVIGKW